MRTRQKISYDIYGALGYVLRNIVGGIAAGVYTGSVCAGILAWVFLTNISQDKR